MLAGTIPANMYFLDIDNITGRYHICDDTPVIIFISAKRKEEI